MSVALASSSLVEDNCSMKSLSVYLQNNFARNGERERRFGQVLRQLRNDIPWDASSLGDFVRLRNRVGKAVSQDEIAEALGVSRCWYGMLESGKQVRPSIDLLERLCDVFRLDPPQRLALIGLGNPELVALIDSALLAFEKARSDGNIFQSEAIRNALFNKPAQLFSQT